MNEVANLDGRRHARHVALRLMLVGSLPPSFGGTTVSLQHLCEFVQERLGQVVVVDCAVRDGRRMRSAVRALFKVIAHLGEVDVVTLHFSDRAAVMAAPWFWLVSRAFRKPVVYRQFGGQFSRTYKALSPLTRWWLRHTILRSDVVLLQTQQMVRDFAFLAERTRWFPTARPRTAFSYKGDFAHQRTSHMRCLFVGHVLRAKGVLAAAEAVKSLPGAQLDVFGPLIDIDESTLQQAGARYGGVLEPGVIPEVMSGYDVLVFPTTYAGEGYPGVLVEAALVGLPMVVTSWQHLPEMFRPDEALFVSPGAPDELRAAIERLAHDRDELLRRSAALRRKSVAFDAEVVFDGFIDTCVAISRRLMKPAARVR